MKGGDIVQIFRDTENAENVCDPFGVLGLNALCIPGFKKPFETFVLDGRNHGSQCKVLDNT